MNETYLEVGKIVAVHGIRGEVKALPWADSPEFLTRFKTLYLVGSDAHIAPSIAGGNDTVLLRLEASGNAALSVISLAVESARVQKTCVLIKFKGVDTVEQAQILRDKVLRIARNDPHIPAGTVFQADLIGLPVRANGREIGTIREILDMPASEVWVVKGEREYMIPNVKAFVPHVDPTLGYVEVNLIEGMGTDAD